MNHYIYIYIHILLLIYLKKLNSQNNEFIRFHLLLRIY